MPVYNQIFYMKYIPPAGTITIQLTPVQYTLRFNGLTLTEDHEKQLADGKADWTTIIQNPDSLIGNDTWVENPKSRLLTNSEYKVATYANYAADTSINNISGQTYRIQYNQTDVKITPNVSLSWWVASSNKYCEFKDISCTYFNDFYTESSIITRKISNKLDQNALYNNILDQCRSVEGNKEDVLISQLITKGNSNDITKPIAFIALSRWFSSWKNLFIYSMTVDNLNHNVKTELLYEYLNSDKQADLFTMTLLSNTDKSSNYSLSNFKLNHPERWDVWSLKAEDENQCGFNRFLIIIPIF